MLPTAATSAAWSAMLRRAHPTAAGDSSTAITRLPGSSVAIDSASAADPEQRSTTSRPWALTGAGTELQHVVDDQLGLGPRDEHARADVQLEVAERREAGQVLQRDPLDPLAHEPGVGLRLLVGDRSPRHPQQGAWPSGDVGQQQLRVHVRRGHTRRGHPRGSRRQQVPGLLHRRTLRQLTHPEGTAGGTWDRQDPDDDWQDPDTCVRSAPVRGRLE